MSVVLLAALALAAAEPSASAAGVLSAPPPPTVSEATAKGDKAKPAKVCWSERPTGSHMPVRTCVTKEEWDQRQRADQDALQPSRRVAPRGGFGPS